MSLRSLLIAASALFSNAGDFSYLNQGRDWLSGECKSLDRQSPVNLEFAPYVTHETVANYSYKDRPDVKFYHKGYTLQLEPLNADQPLGMFTIDGQTFNALQVHLHGPAEHLFESIRRPVELHIVHKNVNNPKDFAVLGITFTESPNPNRWLDFLLTDKTFPHIEGESFNILSDEPRFPELSMLVPAETSLWHYEGSLTTPGCDELVRWYLIPQAIPASHAQLSLLADTLLFNGTNGNFRGIQSNGRLVDAVLVHAKSVDPNVTSYDYLHQGSDWIVGVCANGVAQSPIVIHPYMAEHTSESFSVDWKAVESPAIINMDRQKLSLEVTIDEAARNRRLQSPQSEFELNQMKARISETRVHPDSLEKKGMDFKVVPEVSDVPVQQNIRRRLDTPKKFELGSITWRNDTYYVDVLHFHAPSEHIWRGERRPLEMHVVHMHPDHNSVIILAISFIEDAQNTPDMFLDELLLHGFPGDGQVSSHVLNKFNITNAIPSIPQHKITPDYSVWNYPGSLTTPDCGEHVSWMVFDIPRTASREQLEAFASLAYPGSLGDFRMALEPSASQKLLQITTVKVNGEEICGADFGLASDRVVVCPSDVPAANIKRLASASKDISSSLSMHFAENSIATIHPSGQIVMTNDSEEENIALDYRCIDEHHSFASLYRDQTDSCEFARRLSLNAPSSHFVDGKQYPLELLIHYDDTTLSIPYVAGADDQESPFLKELLSKLLDDSILNDKGKDMHPVINTTLLTRGIGSNLRVLHVTPQCNTFKTGVSNRSRIVSATPWLVLEEPIFASRDQIREITRIVQNGALSRKNTLISKSKGSRKLQSAIPLHPAIVILNPRADAVLQSQGNDADGDNRLPSKNVNKDTIAQPNDLNSVDNSSETKVTANDSTFSPSQTSLLIVFGVSAAIALIDISRGTNSIL